MNTPLETATGAKRRAPWNKGRLVGQKPPLKLQEVWAIRIRLQILNRTRDIALCNLAVDSKLRSCDLVRLRVADVAHAGRMLSRATVLQRKTHSPVSFELTEHTREACAGVDRRKRQWRPAAQPFLAAFVASSQLVKPPT